MLSMCVVVRFSARRTSNVLLVRCPSHRGGWTFNKEWKMSDFRKLLLAFAAVTLFAGIASAGPAPALNHTAQPFSVRDDATSAIAPDIISIDVKVNQLFSVCGAGLQAPAWLNESGLSVMDNAQSLNIGAPALPPAPNIAALESGTAVASGNAPIIANTGQTTLSAPSAQATGTTAATPANLLNSNSAKNTANLLSQTTLGSNILNGTANTNNQFAVVDGNPAADSSVLFNADAPDASTSAGQTAVATHLAAPAQVARTAPTHAGSAG